MSRIDEFHDKLEDLHFALESDIVQLGGNSEPASVYADINEKLAEVRHASIQYELDEITGFVDLLISFVSRLSELNTVYAHLISDVILLCLDHLDDITRYYKSQNVNYDASHTKSIESSLSALISCDNESLKHYLEQSLNVLTSELITSDSEESAEVDVAALVEPAPTAQSTNKSQNLADSELMHAQDLVLFYNFEKEFSHRFPDLAKRSQRILPLAFKMNQLAGSPVDEQQLEAAIILHDLAMVFIPPQILQKDTALEQEEVDIIRRHPAIISILLERLSGWEEAALIVHQHHERMDGKGYPQGLKGEDICPGSKILSILDAFDAMTNTRSDRPFKRTLLRASTEISRRQDQFDPEWVSFYLQTVKENFIKE